MIAVARSLASEVVTIVTTPIPPISVVAVVAMAGILDVEASTVVVSSGRLLVSSCVFSDELLCVVGIGITLGCGEKFGDRGRPL